jgi:hypothetical protein
MTVPGNAKKHIVSGISVIFSVRENIKKKSEDTKGVFIIRKSKKNIYNIMALFPHINDVRFVFISSYL